MAAQTYERLEKKISTKKQNLFIKNQGKNIDESFFCTFFTQTIGNKKNYTHLCKPVLRGMMYK